MAQELQSRFPRYFAQACPPTAGLPAVGQRPGPPKRRRWPYVLVWGLGLLTAFQVILLVLTSGQSAGGKTAVVAPVAQPADPCAGISNQAERLICAVKGRQIVE